MKTRQIKELMVPISDYATIHENATMEEAIKALESEKRQYKDGPYRHQSIVVIDDNHHVVGRLSQVDIMRALEPRYRELDKSDQQWINEACHCRQTNAFARGPLPIMRSPGQSGWLQRPRDRGVPGVRFRAGGSEKRLAAWAQYRALRPRRRLPPVGLIPIPVPFEYPT